MRSLIRLAPTFLILCWPASAPAQEVQVSRTNKTISVVVSETIQVEPEVAEIHLGYHNYGLTKEIAFEENVRIANEITKALLAAGVPKGNVETQAIRLGRVPEYESVPDELRKQRQFEAEQSWIVRVPSPVAQNIVDTAVHAGANEVDEVDWAVTDPTALEGKAHSAALSRARVLAEQIAKTLGVELGELVFASNQNVATRALREAPGFGMALKLAPPPPPNLIVFPQRVRQEATVHAVFAMR